MNCSKFWKRNYQFENLSDDLLGILDNLTEIYLVLFQESRCRMIIRKGIANAGACEIHLGIGGIRSIATLQRAFFSV